MSGRKTFVAGDILTASQVNEFLMDQVVQVYAGTAARGSAIPSATEGMVSYLEDVNKLQVATGTATYVDVYPPVLPAGSVLQTLSAIRTTAVTSTPGANTFADITDLSVTITPISTSSKVFVTYNINVGASASAFVYARVLRGATAIGVGTGGTNNFSAMAFIEDNGRLENLSASVLDSPSTTSATTYKVQFAPASAVTIYANRRGASATDLIAASTITVFEIAG
jgi:hypothetical protein